jgi:hypothetical protein
MSIKLLLTFVEDKSDHDGYCSGNECELISKTYTRIINLPHEEITNNLDYYRKYADDVEMYRSLGYYKSGYCKLSDEAVEVGLDRHDYLVKVARVEIIDEDAEVINIEINSNNSGDK